MRIIASRTGLTTAMLAVIGGVLLASVAILIYSAIFQSTLKVSNDPSVALCQQSAAIAGTIRVPDAASLVTSSKSVLFPFKCPITPVEIKSIDLGGSVSDKRLIDYGFTKKEGESRAYFLDAKMYQQASNCLQKVNFGVKPLFERDKIADSDKTFCVVCSVVSFGERTQKEFATRSLDFAPFMQKQTVLGWGETIPEILAERDEGLITMGALQTTFNVRSRQAVVYYQTPISTINRMFPWLGQYNTQIKESAVPFVRYIPGATFGVAIGDLLTGQDTTKYGATDTDGLIIIDYEKRGSLDGYCSYIGNEPYLETQI